MIKVMNIISDTNIGGAGKCVIYFSQNYDKEKFDVSVVVPKGSALVEELKKTTVKIIEIDGLRDKSFDIGAFFKLVRLIKKEKPDIVHTHASSIARIAAKCVKNTKIVYTRHCAYPVSSRIKKGPGHWIYKTVNEMFANRIIAVGNAAEENLLEGGISKEYISTFFNGVEKLKISSDEEKKKLKEKYKISEKESVIGIVARLEDVKGHEDFIDAAKILLVDKKISAKFFILGTGTIEEKLKEKVKELKLDKEIIFTGFIKNIADYMNIFDVQVNCSYGTETSSLSLLEGMSIGVPAVATDYGGNPYLIQNGENGLIVPTYNPQKVAEAIEKILKNDELKKKMQENAIQIYEEKYTIQTYVENVQGVYERVMKEPKKKKMNVVDIFIIILALIIGILGYRFLHKKSGTISGGPTEKITYQVMATNTIPEVMDMIEEGSAVFDSNKNYHIGTILKKESSPAKMNVSKQDTGEYVENELNDKIDVVITIEANATKSHKDILVGDYVVKVGNEANVKGKGFALKGYVVSIER